MSKFYGTLASDKGETTRAGHHWIRATAQSFEGSVSISLIPSPNEGEGLLAELEVSGGSNPSPRNRVWRVTLRELLSQAGIS